MSESQQDGAPQTERRRGYSELREELHYFFRKIWIVVILIGVTSTLGLVGYGFVLREIQQQRLEVCEDQNTRHDNTEAALRVAAQEDIDNAPTEAMKKEIARRRDVTLGLIDAITPHQNCSEVVDQGLSAYLPW